MGNRPDYTKNFTHSNVTDIGSMYSILQYTDRKDLSLVEVAGYTGNAFRIIIDRERVNVAGYSAYEWPLHHREQFENLASAPGMKPDRPKFRRRRRSWNARWS